MLTYAHTKYWIHPIIILKIMSTQELLWPGLYYMGHVIYEDNHVNVSHSICAIAT